MMKTGQQIVSDIIALLRSSEVVTAINGTIYRAGTRPRDSKKEDLVVIFTTGDADQFQTGVVTINIYVPFLNNASNGVYLENSARCEVLEGKLLNSVTAIRSTSDYRITLRDTISTVRNDDTHESIVVGRLQFKYYN